LLGKKLYDIDNNSPTVLPCTVFGLPLPFQSARGTFWRGRDCRDWDSDFYPGRQPFKGDITADSNCNGIWGIDPATGRPWEDILCKNFDSRGIVYVGDSVGAHFHFPEPWINPLLMSKVSEMDFFLFFFQS
jgi:acyloxyacyl hydrolase